MPEPVSQVFRPLVSNPSAARAFWFLGALALIRLSGPDTGNALSIAETTSRAGHGSPLHVHERDDEIFHVLEGRLQITLGDDLFVAGPRAVAVLPRRIRHAYVVASPTARFITIHRPAGFEGFVEAVGEPAPRLDLPPDEQANPELDVLARTAARFGISIVGPVPAVRDPEAAGQLRGIAEGGR